MKILFITNGHGEDTIATRIIKELPGEDISVYPIVGTGSAFENSGVKILGPRRGMPSGGFIYQSIGNIIKDLSSGLFSTVIKEIGDLRRLKGKFDLVVSVGDIVPIIGALLTKTKFIFVGCAKSDYYSYSYTPWEKFLLRKYCSLSLPRDKKTTDDLVKQGVKAEYVGNPMMDCIETKDFDFGIPQGTSVIGILPGTRDDANLNMEDICRVSEELNKTAAKENKNIVFLVAAAPSSDTTAYKCLENMRLHKDLFGDIINRSDIVIGLSGTGNEQAAGIGKPVVSFPGRGVQYTAAFAKRQKELLSGSLFVTKRNAAAAAADISLILNDKGMLKKMSSAGKERMGVPGASLKIAGIIKKCG
ncbi:MAG: hypothetical protein NTZ10_01675 [Candidatus Saganbacteria bacterium]|nr:hypothetical protein [Candidatus Saganbacteria bacterium]